MNTHSENSTGRDPWKYLNDDILAELDDWLTADPLSIDARQTLYHLSLVSKKTYHRYYYYLRKSEKFNELCISTNEDSEAFSQAMQNQCMTCEKLHGSTGLCTHLFASVNKLTVTTSEFFEPADAHIDLYPKTYLPSLQEITCDLGYPNSVEDMLDEAGELLDSALHLSMGYYTTKDLCSLKDGLAISEDDKTKISHGPQVGSIKLSSKNSPFWCKIVLGKMFSVEPMDNVPEAKSCGVRWIPTCTVVTRLNIQNLSQYMTVDERQDPSSIYYSILSDLGSSVEERAGLHCLKRIVVTGADDLSHQRLSASAEALRLEMDREAYEPWQLHLSFPDVPRFSDIIHNVDGGTGRCLSDLAWLTDGVVAEIMSDSE